MNLYRLLYILAGVGVIVLSQQPLAGESGALLLAIGSFTAGAAFPDKKLPGLK